MAVEAAWHLGVDDLGVSCFKSTRPGYDARTTAASEAAKLFFHSSWDRVERIHQAGSFDTRGRYANDLSYYAVRILFTPLPYRPIVTLRRRSSLTAEATRYGDEWWTDASFGGDPYAGYYWVASEPSYFLVKALPWNFQFAGSHPLINENKTQYFDYIVWKLPADQLL